MKVKNNNNDDDDIEIKRFTFFFYKNWQIRLEIDLNLVSDYNVYELPRSTNRDKKKFHCTVEIKYKLTNATCQRSTNSFVLMGQKKDTESGSKKTILLFFHSFTRGFQGFNVNSRKIDWKSRGILKGGISIHI